MSDPLPVPVGEVIPITPPAAPPVPPAPPAPIPDVPAPIVIERSGVSGWVWAALIAGAVIVAVVVYKKRLEKKVAEIATA